MRQLEKDCGARWTGFHYRVCIRVDDLFQPKHAALATEPGFRFFDPGSSCRGFATTVATIATGPSALIDSQTDPQEELSACQRNSIYQSRKLAEEVPSPRPLRLQRTRRF